MSQQGNSSPTPAPAPSIAKGPRKGLGAVLIALVSLGAFAGAAAGTYATFAYVIMPNLSKQANSGSGGNGGSCTSNCGGGGGGSCGTGCLQGVITGNNNPNSPYVRLDQINATSSTNLSFTIEAVGASSLNGNSIVVTDTTTGASGTNSCPSGQTCTVTNSPKANTFSATGSLTFKTGDSYTMQLSDSGNPSTYNFHF
jgi:hypothetical protein